MDYPISLRSSKRLKRVWDVIKDSEWHGSFEVTQRTKTVAVGSCMADLRKRGFDVATRQLGQGHYEYRLVSAPPEGPSSHCEVCGTFMGAASTCWRCSEEERAKEAPQMNLFKRR